MFFEEHKTLIDKGLGIAALLLVTFLSYQLAQITLLTLSGVPVKASATGFVSISSDSDRGLQEPAADIEALLAWHVFGVLNKQEAIVVEVNIEAPETKLDLILEGVSVSQDPAKSSAIISESKARSGELYWIGDSVAGKAILNAVFDEKIILKHSGRLETLWFSDESKSQGGLSRNDASINPVSTNMVTDPADMLRSYRARRDDKNEVASEIGSALNDVGQGNFQSLDGLLDKYGTNMEGNIEKAISTVGLEQVSDGMRVGNSAQEEWLSQVGLQHGDVIQSVNNYPVITLKSDRSAIDAVVKSCVARIEVIRGERTFVVTYPFCR